MNNPKFWGTVATALVLTGLNYILAHFNIEVAEELKYTTAVIVVGALARYSRNWITESNKEAVYNLLAQIKIKGK